MVFCGVSEGTFYFPLKKSLILVQKILILIQLAKRLRIVSSSELQREHSFVSLCLFYQREKGFFYLNTAHCAIFCIDNTLVLNHS